MSSYEPDLKNPSNEDEIILSKENNRFTVTYVFSKIAMVLLIR